MAFCDERFVRIWECYLAGCEAAFRAKQMTVFQIQLRKKNSPLPMTREYLYPPQTPLWLSRLTFRCATALTDKNVIIGGKDNNHAQNKA